MTTRQEIQIAQDLVRAVNIQNDLFDNAAMVVKGEVSKTVGGVKEDMTVDDIKVTLTRAMFNIRNYNNNVVSFLADSTKRALAVSGLAAWGIDIQSILDDNLTMSNMIQQVENALISALDMVALKAIGDSISAVVIPLLLVRKG